VTTEQIEAIRAAQAELRDFEKKHEEIVRTYREKHWKETLQPLVRVCDHQYPWGDSAIVHDYSIPGNCGTCSICGSKPYR
jgi:ferredoxin-like protein FixX